jgi:hypothetical protein
MAMSLISTVAPLITLPYKFYELSFSGALLKLEMQSLDSWWLPRFFW